MKVRLGMPLMLSDICKAVDGVLRCDDVTVRYVTTDTRELERGDLFFALEGKNRSGEEFIPIAKSMGAYCLGHTGAADICVRSSKDALLALASYYKKLLPHLKHTVGITGSVGKTTTKEFLYVLTEGCFRTHKNEGNLNNHIGLPMTVLGVPADTEILILEMGMNAEGEIAELSECIKPDVAVITNIGAAHIGQLGSRKNIAKAKLEILHGSDVSLVVPANEPLLTMHKAKKFAINNNHADICVCVSTGGIDVIGDLKILDVPFFSSEERNLSCLAAALSASVLLGIAPESLRVAIPKISEQNTRQKEISVSNLTVISDFYNASPESFEAAIRSLSADKRPNEKSVLIGDMLELGEFFFDMHKRLGALAAKYKIDNIFAYGDCCEAVKLGAIEAGFPADRIFLNNTSRPEITAKQIKEACAPDGLILFKASRGMRLEEVLTVLQGSLCKGD